MDLSGDYTFEAPQDMVWQALQDPEILGSVMPGGEGFKETGENEYAGNLNVKVGPVQGAFAGTIRLTDIVPPESYAITVDGRGAPGFVKASGTMRLTPEGEETRMEYAGSAQVGGRIASVGQRLLDASAKSIIRQSLEGLNDYLKTQVAAQAATEVADEPGTTATAPSVAAPGYTPPSQASVAANVARDVAGELIPPRYRPLLIGAAVLLVALLLYLLLT